MIKTRTNEAKDICN